MEYTHYEYLLNIPRYAKYEFPIIIYVVIITGVRGLAHLVVSCAMTMRVWQQGVSQSAPNETG